MAEIATLIEQAESLLKKKIAIKESVPGVFEALSNVDDQLRITINAIVTSGQDAELTSEQINLVNSALSGTRNAIASYQATYRPTVNDLTAEFSMLPQIDLKALQNLKNIDSKLYDSLINDYAIIKVTDFSKDLDGKALEFLHDKALIYDTLKKYDSAGYIDDNIWYDIVGQARKSDALWDGLPQAAKYLQENYGFEFNVKYLENPQGKEGGMKI
jgi:hypothetical protein